MDYINITLGFFVATLIIMAYLHIKFKISERRHIRLVELISQLFTNYECLCEDQKKTNHMIHRIIDTLGPLNVKFNEIEETLNSLIKNQIRLDDLICEELMYYKEMKKKFDN